MSGLKKPVKDARVSVESFTASGDYTFPSSSPRTIIVDKVAPAITTVNLPVSPTIGDERRVIDGSGAASTYNITISGNGCLIDGYATLILSANGETATVLFDGALWRRIGG